LPPDAGAVSSRTGHPGQRSANEINREAGSLSPDISACVWG